MHASYGSYYRRMLPRLLAAVEFRSNNAGHRPLLDAIAAIRAGAKDGRQHYDLDDIAVEGVIRPKWRDIVIEAAPDGRRRVNRINYEICALQSLREKLRCKEVWVAGADRWRDPDDDLPADFEERRDDCYERLALPHNPHAFIEWLRSEMSAGLASLNGTLPRNRTVRLAPHRRHPIVVTPLEPQPVPPTLGALGTELGRRWPMTGLLDILTTTSTPTAHSRKQDISCSKLDQPYCVGYFCAEGPDDEKNALCKLSPPHKTTKSHHIRQV